ncbi:MarR family winged helix-turn-helix transcriptional regulator [Nocardia suismassiliense]|uniref:MarR family winged helix-turn-helix transcriptional regulator n=1 Tax=Nocardia suismassiliense TaxID=2077092 RepID=UPI000D1F2FF0|nr:MarR family transcriptional regulator [Nocardia suismassiliense]
MEISREDAPAKLRALPTRLVNQVALVANRATERALQTTGSRRYHYALLAALGEFGAISQADLGRRTRIDRSDIVATVNELADRGFVERSQDTGDRRRKIVTITDAGTAHLAELDERLAGAQDELLAGLDAAERAEFIRLLTRILDR